MRPLERRGEPARPAGEPAVERWLETLRERALRRSPELGERGPADPGWVLLEVFAEALAEIESRAELVEERVFPRLLESLGDSPRWGEGAITALVFEPEPGDDAARPVPARTVASVPRREGEPRLPFETIADAWTSTARLLRAISVAGETANELFAYPQCGWDGEPVPLFAGREVIARHLYLGDGALASLRDPDSVLVLEWPGSPHALSDGTWEYSVAQGWRALRVEVEDAGAGARRSVTVRVRGPLVDLASAEIEGARLPWLRVGLEGGRRLSFAPPRWLSIEPSRAGAPPGRPVERIYSRGGERWEDHSLGAQKIVPVESPESRDPAVYLGFDRPVPASLVWWIQGRPAPGGWGGRGGIRVPGIVWEHSSGRGFRALPVDDGTRGFTRTGAVAWTLPADWSPQEHFGERLFWVRARWVAGAYAAPPLVKALVPHAALARQQSTLSGVVIEAGFDALGRGTLRLPLAEGYPEPFELVDVRLEGEWSRLELDRRGRARAPEATEAVEAPAAAPAPEPPVLGNFRAAIHPRHGYQLDVGAKWGGAASVRLPAAVAGWGARGNVAAGSVTHLEGGVAGVKRVLQPLAAEGGRDAESPEMFRTRIRSEWRCRGRAVTVEDYRLLAAGLEPLAARVEAAAVEAEPWRVRVCVVPAEPCEPGRLTPVRLDWLSEMLESVAPLGTVVEAMEPAYVQVVAHLTPTDAAPVAEAERRRLEEQLRQLLHPLRGGPHGHGVPCWPWPYSTEVLEGLARHLGEGDTPGARSARARWRLELRQSGGESRSGGARALPGQATLPLVVPCLERLTVEAPQPS